MNPDFMYDFIQRALEDFEAELKRMADPAYRAQREEFVRRRNQYIREKCIARAKAMCNAAIGKTQKVVTEKTRTMTRAFSGTIVSCEFDRLVETGRSCYAVWRVGIKQGLGEPRYFHLRRIPQ